MHEQAMGNYGFTRLTTAWTWGKPPPSPYSVFYAWPHGLHPNVILFRHSQVGSLEIHAIRIFATLEAHNVLCKFPMDLRSKAKL
jgi:hypothetical protein